MMLLPLLSTVFVSVVLPG